MEGMEVRKQIEGNKSKEWKKTNQKNGRNRGGNKSKEWEQSKERTEGNNRKKKGRSGRTPCRNRSRGLLGRRCRDPPTKAPGGTGSSPRDCTCGLVGDVVVGGVVDGDIVVGDVVDGDVVDGDVVAGYVMVDDDVVDDDVATWGVVTC